MSCFETLSESSAKGGASANEIRVQRTGKPLLPKKQGHVAFHVDTVHLQAQWNRYPSLRIRGYFFD